MVNQLGPEGLALRGAVILRRYNHPDDWEDGNTTGKAYLIGSKTLKVEELRIGNPPPGLPANDEARARSDASAILAFARQLRIKIQIDQQPNKAPRIYVANGDWPDALAVLQAL